jgi:hypothetical protein
VADENTIGGVNVEVRASLDQYKNDLQTAQGIAQSSAGTIQKALDGASAATANLTANQKAVVQGLIASGASAKEAAAAFNAMGQSGTKMAAAYAQMTKAAVAQTAATVTDTQATVVNTAAKAAQAEMLAKAAAAAGSNTRALALQTAEEVTATAATTGLHMQTATATREILTLAREASRGNFTRMAGSATILAQAMGLLAPEVIGVTAAVIGVVAVMGYAVYASLAYADAQQKAAIASVGLGAASGLTGAQLQQTADIAQSVSNTMPADAQKAAGAFAAAGMTSTTAITEMTAAVGDYAKLTGEKVPEATKQLADAMADPAKGAVDLNDKLHFLDATELQNIQTLARLGDKTGAQNALAKAFYDRTNDAAKAAGGLRGFLDNLTAGFERLTTMVGAANRQLELFRQFGFAGAGVGQQQDAAAAAAQAKAAHIAQLKTTSALAAPDEADTPESRDQARSEELQGSVARLKAAIAADKELGDQTGVQRATAALAEYTRAETTWRGEAAKAHDVALAQIAAAKAHTPAAKAAAAEQMSLARHEGEVASAAQIAGEAQDAAAVAGDRAAAHSKHHKDAVGEETTKIKENTAALLAEADAYLKADSAGAMRIAAQNQAAQYATTHKGANVGAMTDLFLAQDVAKAGDKGAQQVMDLNEQTAAQKRLDDQLAAGTLTSSDANRILREETQLRPLEAALTNASGKAKEELTRIIAALKDAQAQSNAELEREAVLEATEKQNQSNAVLAQQLALINATNRARDEAIAKTKALQYLTEHHIDPGSAEGKAYVGAAVSGADLSADEKNAQFVKQQTDATQASVKALQDQARTYGMTNEQAAIYLKTQQMLDAAARAGLDLTPEQTAAIEKLGQAYGEAETAAKRLEEQQKAVADASKYLTDEFSSALDDLITKGKSAQEVARDLVKSLGSSALKGVLTGEGPFAGLLGTNHSSTVGGPNGGVLSQLMGSLFKQPGASPNNILPAALGGTAGKPDGTMMNPLFTKSADQGGMGGGDSSNPLSQLMSLFGGGGGGSGAAAGGDSLAGLYHAGGDVGSTSIYRPVPRQLVWNAPRYHAGLAADEHVAILQRGEKVIPRGGQARGGHQVNIHVHGVTDNMSWQRNSRQMARQFKKTYPHA